MLFSISDSLKHSLQHSAVMAAKAWPLKQQAVAAAEELCELSVKLLQWSLGKERPAQAEGIQEEIIDCYIMLQQMALAWFSSQQAFDGALEAKVGKLLGKVEAIQ